MGNRGCNSPEQESPDRAYYDDEDNQRRRRSSSSSPKGGRRSGSRFSLRGKKSRKEDQEVPFEQHDPFERDDPFGMFNDMMEFGFGRGPRRLGVGFGEDLGQIIPHAGMSGSPDGVFQSSHMFSSVTTIGNDGVPVSESKGVSQNSNGLYKMAHQRRIGDKSQTLMSERPNKQSEYKKTQRLHQISHDELPRFSSEFKDRTKEWNSYRAIKKVEKPRLALEDGKRSRAYHPYSHSRPVSNQNYGERSNSYNRKPRGVEY